MRRLLQNKGLRSACNGLGAKSVSLVVLVLVWHLVSGSGIINPLFLPSPVETVQEGIVILREKKIILDFVSTFYRVMAGLICAIGIGIPLGLLLGYFVKLFNSLEWLVDFFRSIPPVLTFPLALLVFGTGDGSRIAVIFFGCVFIMILNTSLGVIHSPGTRVDAARIIGARFNQILLRVVFFDSLPQIFVGIRVSLSMAIIIGIVTEMLVGTRFGLGSRVVYAQTAYATAEMYFIIIVVGVAGFVMNKVLVVIEKRIVHWI